MARPESVPVIAAAAVLVVLALAIPGDAVAQSERGHSLVPKTWGFVFRVGPDFQLNSFRGSTIGAKYQTSANRAWRGSLLLTAYDQEIEYTPAPVDSQILAELDGASRSVYGLSLERQSYLDTGSEVHAYWTLGPRVLWSSWQLDYDAPTSRRIEQEQLDLRIGAEFGGEWFATRALSLSAAYAVSAGWSRVTEEGSGADPDREFERSIETWSLGGEGAWLGLNVYF